ncbi:uncharacterized protein LOC141599466 [Silene latifolia]|uniref:uncharacterized protein LOC141599466 n=1 Tax=Silene latifolia TaxID=37657 RepID=UPI003D779947
MCIAVFIWQSHPLYPLLLLLNRDEYHTRPTTAAGWWEGGEILGGRDELGGGTWLACSKNGRLSFLTNFREIDSLPQSKSRGELPVRFLQSEKGPTEFAEEIIQEADRYNGFNLVVADLHSKSMVYITNRPKENKPSFLHVSSGTHVLTNASLDTLWPKAERLLGNFKEMMETYGESEVEVHEIVEKLMTDTTKHETLQGILSPHFEHHLSSIFVNIDNTPDGRYGTRSTSVVLAKTSGEVCFHERYLVADHWKEHMITYQI